MCGIAGIVDLNGFDPARLTSMTHLVRHRGPDGFGFAFFGLNHERAAELILNEDRSPRIERPIVGLGHRRLAILDLSALGSQPMQTEDGWFSVVFNGEIYNYIELRQELECLGYLFRTRTDTEIILHAYREWGKECLKRFNGMWSFALWDGMRRQLFCARDRFGEKPFYYYRDEKRFLLGSEIKQIAKFPGVPRRANHASIFDYLERGILNAGQETFFQNILELPGGHSLTLDLASGRIEPRVERYWELVLQPLDQLSDGAARADFTEKFIDAVRLRMRSDVPVGSCLSGGLDSSSIVCVARALVPHADFHTFSACYEDPAFDERNYVREVADAVHVQSHRVFPSAEQFRASLEKLLWHQDEPIGGSSVFAQYTVMQAAREQGVPVLLDGQGGDEALCGYRKYYYFHLWHLLKRKRPGLIPEALAYLWRGDKVPLRWSDASRYLPAPFQRRTSLLAQLSGDGLGAAQGSPAIDIGPGQSLAGRQKADLCQLSLPVLLRYEDRNSMAHSIETRLPFLDYRLAEFLVNCPEPLKLRGGWTKWILRNALKGVLPEKVRLRRRKLGFDTPEEGWLRTGLCEIVMQVFAEPKLTTSPYLDVEKVRAEFQKFYAGRRDALPATWLLRPLILELWAKVHDVHLDLPAHEQTALPLRTPGGSAAPICGKAQPFREAAESFSSFL
jgi:asparagine synthase (glutamine-hydrolysing)